MTTQRLDALQPVPGDTVKVGDGLYLIRSRPLKNGFMAVLVDRDNGLKLPLGGTYTLYNDLQAQLIKHKKDGLTLTNTNNNNLKSITDYGNDYEFHTVDELLSWAVDTLQIDMDGMSLDDAISHLDDVREHGVESGAVTGGIYTADIDKMFTAQYEIIFETLDELGDEYGATPGALLDVKGYHELPYKTVWAVLEHVASIMYCELCSVADLIDGGTN